MVREKPYSAGKLSVSGEKFPGSFQLYLPNHYIGRENNSERDRIGEYSRRARGGR